jgi:hypothetical protein
MIILVTGIRVIRVMMSNDNETLMMVSGWPAAAAAAALRASETVTVTADSALAAAALAGLGTASKIMIMSPVIIDISKPRSMISYDRDY